MPAIIHGVASWPGVSGVRSCSYTIGHGIMPSTAILTCNPQARMPATLGNLVFYDGSRSVTIPNCRLGGIKTTTDASGTVWHLEITDRRWKWRATGVVAGLYNQRDYRNRFIPWTVRTNTALCSLCLDAMGESGYTVAVPNTALLPIDWDYVNPAKALEDLAEGLGCRVVYRLDTDTVAVVPLGSGTGILPAGSIAKQGPSAQSPEVPDSLLLVGAPTRHQTRIRLVACGEEWDKSFRELENLSYKPTTGATRHVVDIESRNAKFLNQWQVTIDGAIVTYVSGADGGIDVANGLAAAINASADPRIRGKVTARRILISTLELTGPANGAVFVVKTKALRAGGDPDSPPPSLTWKVDVHGKPSSNSWAYCSPPAFADVQRTARLTYQQAVEKARGSVFKHYALANVDVSDPRRAAFVPGFGRLARIFQLIPSMSQVEQVVPAPNDARIIGRDGQPLTVHFYDGYSRDKPAEVYGSYHWAPTGVIFAKASDNSDPDLPVIVPFTIDNEQLVLQFSDYVYKLEKGAVLPASIVLQTAVQVRDAQTNQVVRYLRYYEPPGPKAGTRPAVFRHDDIRLVYAGVYDPSTNRLLRVVDNKAECEAQAQYYLLGHMAQFQVRTKMEREYNGIVPIAIDGSIHQVTWTVGESGCSTQASLHSEHSTYLPPYPERRRISYLSPAQLQADPRVGDAAGNTKPGPSMAPWKQ